ncbi:MAG: hypothetical protein JKY48_12130 [Flavobacteriales bacterium]|nr:hypothetical protein [Flavobacteriales bacterium]
MAAMLTEGATLPEGENKEELIFHYIDSALNIAIKHNLKNEQAGLYNEKGYVIGEIAFQFHAATEAS